MSGVGTNSELLLAGYDAWNSDDCEAWLALLEPDAEISTSGVFPDLSAVYRGYGEATKFWRQMHAPWETFRIAVEHVEDEGDCALAAIRFSAKGVDSGIEVECASGWGSGYATDWPRTWSTAARSRRRARRCVRGGRRRQAPSDKP